VNDKRCFLQLAGRNVEHICFANSVSSVFSCPNLNSEYAGDRLCQYAAAPSQKRSTWSPRSIWTGVSRGNRARIRIRKNNSRTVQRTGLVVQRTDTNARKSITLVFHSCRFVSFVVKKPDRSSGVVIDSSVHIFLNQSHPLPLETFVAGGGDRSPNAKTPSNQSHVPRR